jgi:DNA adenine methylase
MPTLPYAKRCESHIIAEANECQSLPLLRWAGSKKRQFNRLQNYFPPKVKCYIEPFAGSAAFFFRLRPLRARLNDINKNVTDFYKLVRDEPAEFYRDFCQQPRNRKHYYFLREKFNQMRGGRDKSICFYYLNRNCFNGIYRTNKLGEFNVPFSDSRVSPYLEQLQFLESVRQVSRTEIHNLDFEEFCDEYAEKGDFVYLDPPYFREGHRIFNEYNAFPFACADFGRLSRTLDRLDQRGTNFLLSFARTGATDKLGRKWHCKAVQVMRTIASNPIKRRKQVELLIYNYDIDA